MCSIHSPRPLHPLPQRAVCSIVAHPPLPCVCVPACVVCVRMHTQGFHFHATKTNPRLEIYSELGCSLEDLMPDEEGAPRLGLGLVQKVMSALVGALAHLHERGVVHR